MHRLLIHRLLALLLLALCSVPAFAVNYVFPGNIPAGCTGGGANYTCPGGGGLGYNDTVTITGNTPITITINGNISTNNARINANGSAANLTLRVNGTLTVEYQAVINGNVQATVVNGTGGEAVFGGNITTTTGAINIGYNNTVAGNITSTTGAINIGGISRVSGQVSCNCALSLDYDARVSGTVSAASVVSDGRVFLQGSSVTTTGNVDIGYGSTLSGAVTAGGTIRLRGNIQAAQCLRSTSASAITLEWADRANGGVCCGALGSCSTSCVANGSGAAMPSLCSGSPPVTTPARFNAFDTTTGSGITGYIKTKVSGTAFSVAVVAINAAGTGVATSFTGNVRVEVLDADDNSGAMNATTNCRASWGVASGTSATTLTFAASDAGRKNVGLTVAEAFREARIRVSYPATGTPTVVGCSTDAFAIRPSSFVNVRATDDTSSSAGTTRTLANTGTTGGNVHKAGQPFTVRAMPVNSSGTTTSAYTGTVTSRAVACVGTGCTTGALDLVANVTAADAGLVSTSTAAYTEAGVFTFTLVDSSFANIDAADGSTTAEREIVSNPLTVGRFVPDNFAVAITRTPVLQTFGSNCAARSFTYFGQPFGYATLPRATVTARNASNGTTLNYQASRFSGLQPAASYSGSTANLGLATSGALTTVQVTSLGSARADVDVTGSTLLHTAARSATTPQARLQEANYAIALTFSLVDASETSAGVAGNEATQGSSAFPDLAFDTTNHEFRYGQLRVSSAYGSELVALPVPLETQYWNGTAFVTNTADHCTVLPTPSVSLANFRASLAACETLPTTGSVTFTSGLATMRLQAPGNGNKGSVDATVQLGTGLAPAGAVRCAAIGTATAAAVPAALPWLQSRAPAGTTYDQNPSARLTFGPRRSPLIQLREVY